MAGRKTPVMQQHAAAKREHPDAVVFFRLGDFYEMFGDDAVLCARELELTLTSRNKGHVDEIPMAGVPHHSAHSYIARLLERGFKVAICEQMADPTKVRGIVPRQVVRVLTPGQVTDGGQLANDRNNWLAALETTGEGVGVALVDLSTAELRAAEFQDLASALGELARAAPREILIGVVSDEPGLSSELATSLAVIAPGAALREDEPLSKEGATSAIGELSGEVAVLPQRARDAVGRALRFLRRCNPGKDLPFVQVGFWNPSANMVLDPTAQSHLELVESVVGGKQATLLGVLDITRTPMGARLMRGRITSPLLDVEAIRRRLDIVEIFVVQQRLRSEFRDALDQVGDLERLAVRAALGEANPRDLAGTRDGLAAAARCVEVLQASRDLADKEALGLNAPVDVVSDLQQLLGTALVERPPQQAKEGPTFQTGFDGELDELDELRRSGTERMVALEAELRERTGISNLKLRYTRVFGWYIEVTRSQASKAPEQWRRKQTVATGERYTNPEVDDLADRLAHAEERYRERELELIRGLVEGFKRNSERVRKLATLVASWDVAAALAELAHRNDYCRPEVDDGDCLEIRDGRHPVVERLAAAGGFVPNDVVLDTSGERLWLITGPNMAGKSTLLRQAALIVIMAQVGSYVPARYARVGVVDRVLSRVGASDNVARGESTFMVEMRETSQILRQATRRSLVILDEVGRGTSTFDGLAIAWAVAEHLDEVIGCRALFATHYHELTAFAGASEHAANYSVSARELGDDVVFLHRLVSGAASRSYGIAVARLAGIPEVVVARARTILAELEEGGAAAPKASTVTVSPQRTGKTGGQLSLFSGDPESRGESDVLDALVALDLNRLSPIEALQVLSRLQKKLVRRAAS